VPWRRDAGENRDATAARCGRKQSGNWRLGTLALAEGKPNPDGEEKQEHSPAAVVAGKNKTPTAQGEEIRTRRLAETLAHSANRGALSGEVGTTQS
jgi:hypothetical protein